MLTASPIPLFVELCAGTAAVSLRLAQPKARPPVSRMGAKTGYADAILYHLHLQPGQGAESYLWCDPDPGVRLLLGAYADRELCRSAADILRSWSEEGPRALWDRLRADEGATGATAVARMWLLWAWAFRAGFPDSGFIGKLDESWREHTSAGVGGRVASAGVGGRVDIRPAAIPPQANARGAVVYIDPPYVNTTGYAHDLPRAEVERLALAWAEAGATVAISEAEPIALPGWEHVQIDGLRRGQTRTFSKQQAEWLTIWRAL